MRDNIKQSLLAPVIENTRSEFSKCYYNLVITNIITKLHVITTLESFKYEKTNVTLHSCSFNRAHTRADDSFSSFFH